LKQANLSLTLAKERYKLGLSSIVELSDSELEQTSAQIQYTNARYEYRLGMAVLRYQLGK
jgi:outer membrane protein